jgi:hypothetical protein
MENLNKLLSNSSNYRVFHHVIEESPQLCISGHKVRHFTYLFDILKHTILKLGTSYCKKHGLLKVHIKNDLLITVLRELVDSGSFLEESKSINLSKNILNSLCLTIEKQIEIFQNVDITNEDTEYYDYLLPLQHLKRDVLEIKGEYFIEENFPEYSGEYFSILERIDDLLDYRENDDITKIEKSLTNIQNEILQLLNSEEGFTNDIEEEFEKQEFEESLKYEEELEKQEFEESLKYEKQELEKQELEKQELEIQENIKIEESLKYEKQELEKQIDLERYEEYENFEKQQIDSISEEYYENKEMEDVVKNILKEITDSIKESENTVIVEKPVKQNNMVKSERFDFVELAERASMLRQGINELKIELAVFQNNLYHLKQDIEEQRNRHREFFLKHNIPWVEKSAH